MFLSVGYASYASRVRLSSQVAVFDADLSIRETYYVQQSCTRCRRRYRRRHYSS